MVGAWGKFTLSEFESSDKWDAIFIFFQEIISGVD